MFSSIGDFFIRVILAVALAVLTVLFFGNMAEAKKYDSRDVRTLLAQSCIGEAGWDAHARGECEMLMHLYQKRTALTGIPIKEMVLRYSAAVKRRKQRHNPWVVHLDSSCTKPDRWPHRLNWDRYKADCEATFYKVDLFLEGHTIDPYPECIHYGSQIDHHRAVKEGWKRVKTENMRNWCYEL